MKKIFILALLIFAGHPVFSVPFTEIPSQVSPFGDVGRVVFADFDMDGDLDCVQVVAQNNVAWGVLLENNRGLFQINSMFGFNMPHHGASAVACGDIDNDGRMDLAVNVISNQTLVVRNRGGGFDMNNPDWSLPDLKEDITDLAFADFNNDGNIDLVVAHASNRNMFYQGNGAGGFIPSLTLPRTNDTISLASADLNKDGNVDLIAANRSKTNYVYLLNGAFGVQRTWTNKSPYYTTCAAAGDINNDNWLDVVYGKNLSPSSYPRTNLIEVYTNNHAGSFGQYQVLTNIFNNNSYLTYSVTLGDIDNDRDLDLAVGFTYPWNGPFYIYTNANNRLSKSVFNQNDQQTRGQLEFIDYDNDGDLDLYSSLVFENKSPVYAAQPGMKWPGGVVKTSLYNQDRLFLAFKDKVVVGTPRRNGSSWQWETGAGYTNATRGNIYSAAVGDVNGVLSFNDRDDYVIASKPGWLYLYTNNSPNPSTTTFQLVWSNRPIPDYTPTALAMGDVNGDGAPDLLYSLTKTNGGGGNDTNQGLYIQFNNNGGFNTNKIHLPPMMFAGGALYMDGKEVRIEDLDNDGDNDIVMASGGPDLIYYNKGQGMFDEATSCYPEVGDTKSIDLGDADSDGDLDVVRGNGNNFTYLYKNNNGVISPAPDWQSPTFNDVYAVRLSDVDQDGDLDLAVANKRNYYSFIMKNNGSGLGTIEDDYLWKSRDVSHAYSSIILKDFDGDSDPDFFLAGADEWGTSFSNEIYKSLYAENFISRTNLPNTPTYIRQQWTNQGPGGAPNDLSDVAFNIVAYDNEGRTNRDALIRFQVSILDGTVWKDATINSFNGTPGPFPSSFFIKASPGGYTNRMVHWNAIADRIQGNRFVMRMVVYPLLQNGGKLLHSSYSYYMYGNFYINGGPSAKIVTPKENEKVSGRVQIYGAAYDYDFNRYILTITNFAGGARVAGVTNTNAVPPVGLLYEWNTASLPSGQYGIRLDVYDNLYTDPVSDTATVTVQGVSQDSPAVTAVYPTNNMQNAAVNAPVIVKFSRYMNENTLRDGTMRVNDGLSALEGNLKYKSIVKSLIFEPNPNLSFNRTHIANVQAAFKDVLGNPLGNDFFWNFKAEQFLPGTIASYSPQFEDVATNTYITLRYSVNMSSYSNFNDDTFSVRDLDGNKVAGSVTNVKASNIIHFRPVGGLKGSTLYIVRINKEIIPDSVPMPFSWYFITMDMVTPAVLSTTPAAGDDFFNPEASVLVHFNKTMNINMLQENIFSLKDSRGNAVAGSLIYDLEDNNLIFTPENPLNDIEQYTAQVSSRFQDMGGHPMPASYTWSFRTTRVLSSAGGELESADGKIKLRVPKNAITSDTAISISRLPSASIPAATDAALKSTKLGYSFEPSGLDFNKAVTIRLSYPDADNNGLVDDPDTGVDLSPPVDEAKLALFYYDADQGQYERIGGTVDPAANTITASLKHFSTYAILEDSNVYAEDLAVTEITTYPRIFSPSQDSYVDINFSVKLTGSGKADIKVYNLAGRLVKELDKEMSVSQGINYVKWDGKDQDGDTVHDRMYVLFIHVTDTSGKSISKTKTLVVME